MEWVTTGDGVVSRSDAQRRRRRSRPDGYTNLTEYLLDMSPRNQVRGCTALPRAKMASVEPDCSVTERRTGVKSWTPI